MRSGFPGGEPDPPSRLWMGRIAYMVQVVAGAFDGDYAC
jgi:hypothetical protein